MVVAGPEVLFPVLESKNLMRNRILYISGALTPCLFFGWWWLPATPCAFWLLKRVLAILPTAASMRAVKEREAEGLFFLAALSGMLKAGRSEEHTSELQSH